jgi:hypothetical protein
MLKGQRPDRCVELLLTEDIKTLHRHLSQRTSHVFDLNIPDQNGVFFNLVQGAMKTPLSSVPLETVPVIVIVTSAARAACGSPTDINEAMSSRQQGKRNWTRTGIRILLAHRDQVPGRSGGAAGQGQRQLIGLIPRLSI